MTDEYDIYTIRDDADREDESGRDFRAHSEGNPCVLVRVISSTGSTRAQTTYLCQVVTLTNAEDQGADLTFTDDGPRMIATGIGQSRPKIDMTHCYLSVNIDGRNILLNY